jgi:hypothetical protein
MNHYGGSKMKMREIAAHINDNFSIKYVQFGGFQKKEQYIKYWNKCMDVFKDRDLLNCIIFCNDVFCIPPVKTFLFRFRNDFIQITGKNNAELDDFVKRSIGAFWAMVFKDLLEYQTQKSISVSMNDYFMVKTASCYSNPKIEITLEAQYGG